MWDRLISREVNAVLDALPRKPKGFMFDLDGTLILSNRKLGSYRVIPGAVEVLGELERRGLMQRNASPEDRRVRLLRLTAEGRKLLQAVEPDMLKAQQRILKPEQPPRISRRSVLFCGHDRRDHPCDALRAATE